MVFRFPFRESEQVALFVVTFICVVLDTVIVALRLFAGRKGQRAFDWSDAALVAAWVSVHNNTSVLLLLLQRSRVVAEMADVFPPFFLALNRFARLPLGRRSWLVSAWASLGTLGIGCKKDN